MYWLPILALLWSVGSFAQERFTLSGYVKDKSNGEALVGATVIVNELSTGNVTNVYGFYSITVPKGDYTIDFRYIGYTTLTEPVALGQNVRLDVELKPEEQELEAVVVSARPEDENVTSVEMSVAELDIKAIEKVPAFLGEVDLVRSIQLLPGVTTVGEGASGFNVRGGSVGQNLILLDEAPVYNSSHLFGFFSVFNPDAVKDVKLYKGGIPAQYGGRLSSILDVRMKEGNSKEFEGTGGIGTVFSRLALEGPLVKDKASFIVAGRRSYIDVLARPFLNDDLEGTGLYFYDLTLKTNYRISDKDQVYLSGYFGRDVFSFDAQQGFDWGNKTATLRWNHLFNDRIFSNTSFFLSDYDYAFQFGETEDDLFQWRSRILTYDLKEQFSYFINTHNELSFGGEAILYRFKPAEVKGASAGEVSDLSLDERKSLELALYAGNEQKVSDRLSLQYGLRFSGFSYLGSGQVYYYDQEGVPGERKEMVRQETADSWETIQFYSNLEPRFSFNYRLNPSTSIKGSYNRMSQYLHLISNTAASLPTDVWMPSTNNLRPQIGDQVALGVFRNFLGDKLEASVEVYYKETQNQVDYIDGAELLINPFLEADLLTGNGRAYGAEFFVKKRTGAFTGWASYTLARTELQVQGINDGEWYPTRFDQTHNLKLTTNYDLSERWSFSSTFTYISGTPYTLPSYRLEVQGYTIPGVIGRNNGRIPDYHRMDISATLYDRPQKADGSMKKIRSHVVFTVYNLYARKNPFSIYFAQGEAATPDPNASTTTRAMQVAILGTFVPAVSVNFKF